MYRWDPHRQTPESTVEHLLAVRHEIGSILSRSTPTVFPESTVLFPGCHRGDRQTPQTLVPGIDVAFCPEGSPGPCLREISGMRRSSPGFRNEPWRGPGALFQTICPTTIELEPIKPSSRSCFGNACVHHLCNRKPVLHGLSENRIDYYAIWSDEADYPPCKDLPKPVCRGPCSSRNDQAGMFFANHFPSDIPMLVNEQLAENRPSSRINIFTSPTRELQYSA